MKQDREIDNLLLCFSQISKSSMFFCMYLNSFGYTRFSDTPFSYSCDSLK